MHKRFPLIIVALLAFGLLTACQNTPKAAETNKFKPVIDKWVAQDAVNPPPKDAVLFIGSSSIRNWKSVYEDFPQYDVINRGFGGSTFADANLFIDQIVTPYQPAAIVVFEGSNDIARGKSADEVFNDYKTFVKRTRKGEKRKDPAPIFFIGITPTESRWKHWPQMRKLNNMVIQYAGKDPSLYYIDTPTPILATAPEPGGPPSRELFHDDLLHLSPKGYALWTRIITPQLEAVYPPTKPNTTAE